MYASSETLYMVDLDGGDWSAGRDYIYYDKHLVTQMADH